MVLKKDVEINKFFDDFAEKFNLYLNTNNSNWIFGIQENKDTCQHDKYSLFMLSDTDDTRVQIVTSVYSGYIERYMIDDTQISINYDIQTTENHSDCLRDCRLFRIFNEDNIDKDITLVQLCVPFKVYKYVLKKVCLVDKVNDIRDMKRWFLDVYHLRIKI